MSTNRFRFQKYIESILGCSDIERWGEYKGKLTGYSFSSDEADTAKLFLQEDAADLYYKACLSLCKALNSLYRGYHSWSVVNLYYSSFYSMRSHLAVLDVGIVKNKGIFQWRVNAGDSPIRVGGKEARNDHQATLKAFKDVVESDVLATNSVDGDNVYDWLMEQRNQIQYRDRSFFEPNSGGYFHSTIFQPDKFEDLITKYISDSIPIYCFDPEHCMLAAPIRRLLDSKIEFQNVGLPDPLSNRKETVSNLVSDITNNLDSKIYRLFAYSGTT